MGASTSSVNEIENAKKDLERAQRALNNAKLMRAEAKKNGSYARQAKNHRSIDGRIGTGYDSNVWLAEEGVKKAKQRLANARKK
jgi:hypothetical protein